MPEIVQLFIGVVVLVLGVPIGSYLAKHTRDESREGQKWFKLILIISTIGAISSLIYRNDALLFGFSFIAIVTSRNLKKV